MSQDAPSVGVVIPTRDRPELLRRAVRSVLEQDYLGSIEVVVVHDGTPLDHALEVVGPRCVRVVGNSRTPGLAGARNSGVVALETDLVAFCDDDDYWLPGKLTAQVGALQANDVMVTCSIDVEFEGKHTVRRAGSGVITRPQLLRSRMSMLHSSTFVLSRAAMLGDLGLVDEAAPGSQNEDWDLLLRASALCPIRHVDEPLVVVSWGRASFFSRRWASRNESLLWMLDRHPDIAADPTGYSRVLGQMAFGSACLGHRREAWRRCGRALRVHPTQWRAYVAAVVAVVPASGEFVLGLLNRFGRGV